MLTIRLDRRADIKALSPSRWIRLASVCGSVVCSVSAPVFLPAQALQGAIPPQPRPQTLAQLADVKPLDRFGAYDGPRLGERFSLGNGKPEPDGTFVVDVLPQKHNGEEQGTGTYQLAIQASDTVQLFNLINEDRTLAAQGVLDVVACAPRLSLSDGTRVFATIEVRRDSLPRPVGWAFEGILETTVAPAAFRVTDDQRSHRSDPIGFNAVGHSIVPMRFALPGGDGERVEVRFGKERVDVRHTTAKRRAKVFDERMVVSLAWMAYQLPSLLGLTAASEVERASRNCA